MESGKSPHFCMALMHLSLFDIIETYGKLHEKTDIDIEVILVFESNLTCTDWHFVSILGLSMCIGVRIISTKSATEMFATISRIRRVRSYAIPAVQSYDNNATEAMKAHT